MKKNPPVHFANGIGPKNLGKDGWGFDVGEYRIVMYIPSHLNPQLNTASDEQQHSLDDNQDEYRVTSKPNRNKRKRVNFREHAPEHGPAHVHVIHKGSFRESSMCLVEDQNGHDFCMYMFPSGDAALKKELHFDEWYQAKKIVDKYAKIFIKFWRENYVESHLSGCVTRADELLVSSETDGQHWRLHLVDSLPPKLVDPDKSLLARPIRFRSVRDGLTPETTTFDQQFDSVLAAQRRRQDFGR